MLKEVHNQYSKYLCDKLLLAHSANYDIHTRMFVSHKYFGDTVLRPSTAAPGSNCRRRPPLVTPQRLPSQPHDITAPWTVPHYTAWWQRHVCVRTTYPRLLPESVTAGTQTRFYAENAHVKNEGTDDRTQEPKQHDWQKMQEWSNALEHQKM